jgi:hypothetical protein
MIIVSRRAGESEMNDAWATASEGSIAMRVARERACASGIKTFVHSN